ncbi:dnaJ homolog subfamily C member 12 isoform X2 [Arvicanthis niloticus]|uniref:dnaJ homolog subfamily C member 12 isoform X2 n=1 Tax=Arvicanthis niloticus TaxID=61156 RepID=UPI00402B5C0B
MDAILNYRPEGSEDYYALLGCDELSSVEQILAEFKVRALECHPDKHPENSKAVETFQKLQKAKEILCNAESRARYDHWRRSQMSMSFEQWEALADSVKTRRFHESKAEVELAEGDLELLILLPPPLECIQSMHWAVRNKKDLMLEGSGQTFTNTVPNKERREQRVTKKGDPEATPEKMIQKESEPPEKGISPQDPDSPDFYQ